MHHLIIGYGYCGYHLAQHLLAEKQEATVLSRHLADSLRLEGVTHLSHDINTPLKWSKKDSILYYLVPPLPEGREDRLLQNFLAKSQLEISKIVYFGSSAVYGEQQGVWVDEQTPCLLATPRQQRRLDAEQQWQHFAQKNKLGCILLRIAGIFGPGRLPLDAARNQVPLIEANSAPYTNHIYVKDLCRLAYQLAIEPELEGIYNLADGQPLPMGSLQQQVAKELALPTANYESWQQAWERASPAKREFMQASKRLRIRKLEITLGHSLHLTSFVDAIKESLKGILA